MTDDDRRAVEPRYRIGAVSQETGISAETIRIWERRYQVVVPGRSPRGGRLYSDAQMARLRLIKQLVDRGHAIGQVAPLDEKQMQAILARVERATDGAPDLTELRRRFIAAVDRLDARGAQAILARAALLLGARTLVLELVSPLLKEIGDRWAAGTTRVCHEHLASGIVRTVLGSLIGTQPVGAAGRRMLVAAPAGEQHELGALVAALLASAAGWDVLYLGPNLPAEEILEAARQSGAAVVALSVVNAAERPEETIATLREIAEKLPAPVTLVLGGRAELPGEVGTRGRRFADLEAFDGWLRAEALDVA